MNNFAINAYGNYINLSFKEYLNVVNLPPIMYIIGAM